jgi:hypothetical protein
LSADSVGDNDNDTAPPTSNADAKTPFITPAVP